MTPAEFMTEIALPTALEFRQDLHSRRRAYLTCIAVFHVKDHLSKAGAQGIEAAVRGRTDDMFDVVRGVCNGTKHVQTDARHRVAFAAGDDTDQPDLGYGVGGFGVGRFDGIGGREIEVDGRRVDLYNACAAVLRAYVALYPQHFAGCDLSAL